MNTETALRGLGHEVITPDTQVRPTAKQRCSAAEISRRLESVFAEQINHRKRRGKDCTHLASHSINPSVIRGHVDTVCSYYSEVERAEVILDWGCSHAPDSCTIRLLSEESELKLFGCDVDPVANEYAAFHDLAGLQYHQLTHPFRLPYEDHSFDLVIGSGVIEHVPDDSASLREVHRILKVKGTLVLTYIPNRWSIAEALLRLLGYPYHRRLYRPRQVKEMLLHHGFNPIRCKYHHVTPTLSGARNLNRYGVWRECAEWLYRCNPVLEWLLPFCWFGQNIMVVATKEESI